MRSLLFRSNKTRLIILLLELLDQYGLLGQYGEKSGFDRPLNPAKLTGIKLSHQDLASLIGATRESVTNLLGELQQRGIVQCGRQKVVVCDSARLRQEADGESSSPTTSSQRRHNPIVEVLSSPPTPPDPQNGRIQTFKA